MTNSNEKYEHAKFAIGRYDHYLNVVNSKGSFYIAVNTFLLGSLFTAVTAVFRQLDKPWYVWGLLSLFAVSSLVSIILTILAINPFLRSGNNSSRNRSLLFFGSVAEYQKDNYRDAFTDQDSHRMLRDTVDQSWTLATALVSKYRKLQLAGYLLIAQFALLIPIIYSININLPTK
jgi:hypothetical protein